MSSVVALLLIGLVYAQGDPEGLQSAPTNDPEQIEAIERVQRQQKRYALLVGTSEPIGGLFRELTPDSKALKYPWFDLEIMEGVLKDPVYGGFEVYEVLYNEDRDTVVAAWEAIQAKLEPGDTFLFYFSGHGFRLSEDSTFYLVMEDTLLPAGTLTPPMNGLSNDWLLWMVDQNRSTNNIVIIDACLSKVQFKNAETRSQDVRPPPVGALDPKGGEVDVPVAPSAFGDYWMFSASLYGNAYEHDDKGHSIYTFYLAQAMRRMGNAAANQTLAYEVDQNRDGLLSVQEAHEWAAQRTEAFAKSFNRRQVPHVNHMHGGGGNGELIYLAGPPELIMDANQRRGEGDAEAAPQAEQPALNKGIGFKSSAKSGNLLGFGGGLLRDPEALVSPPVVVHLQGWNIRGPWLLGLQATTSALSSVPADRSWQGVHTARFLLGRHWGSERFRSGPVLGVGSLMRTYTFTNDVSFATLYSGAAHLRWTQRNVFVSADLGADVVRIDTAQGFEVLPVLRLTAGVAFATTP